MWWNVSAVEMICERVSIVHYWDEEASLLFCGACVVF